MQKACFVLSVAVALLFAGHQSRGQTVPAALDEALQYAKPGHILTHGVTVGPSNFYFLNNSTNRLPNAGGHLLYSDSPETVLQTGILYEDSFPAGGMRLYLYHVNGLQPAALARITAVLSNEGNAPAQVTFTAKSNPTPTGNYVISGRTGIQQYYENTNLPAPITIPVGGRALLDPALDTQTISYDQLVNATYDFTSDQPLKVSSLKVGAGIDTLAAYPTLTVSPNDKFLRQGTFPHNTRENENPYSYRTGLGIRRIRLGGNANDPWDPAMAGWDVEREMVTSLSGNFAVTYRIRVNVRSDDGKALALLLNPRGGAYGGYVRTTFPQDSGKPTGQLVPNPMWQVLDNTKAAVCSFFEPDGREQTLLIETIPAGASSLPIDLWLVPYTAPPAQGAWFMVR